MCELSCILLATKICLYRQVGVAQMSCVLPQVAFLVAAGADKTPSKTRDGAMSALHVAAAKGRLDVVRFLVEEGGDDVNQSYESGATPLYYAVCGGHPAVVRYFIEAGAEKTVRLKDEGVTSLLYVAADRGHLATVRYLLEAGFVDSRLKVLVNTAFHGLLSMFA